MIHNSTIPNTLSASTYEYPASFRPGNLKKMFVLHPKSDEPISRLASHSQYIYLQIFTGTLLLCPSRDFLRSSFSWFHTGNQANWTQLFMVLEQTQCRTCLQNKAYFVIEPSVSLMISCFFLVAGVFLASALSSSSSSEARPLYLVILGEFMSVRRLGITLSWMYCR